ncbi:right-handed parallel beta-helix repeat-containing protein [Polyangium sp. 15x6]|uniref:right-handed parallel beta-helix repeat-containing protein n=1 Tax=Polyangium sp. 15x6 TaxID=3042687 RepID=UPI00249A20B2|nr:right-handed parallel beta-helix repeat-containing protein [Polyangium sp. 15x6]MDI3289017.1 right-handed parallel beta-helix repeat-containing protein [Polyangium sp. 15x6]
MEKAMPWMRRPISRDLLFTLLFVLFAFGGCSDEPGAPAAPAPPKTCPAGEMLLEDGRCQPAGLPLDMTCPPGEWEMAGGGCAPAGLPPDMACPPGEMEKEGGGCEPAGIPPEMCAPGFVADGNRGCEAILPADPCPDGMMAVPGDTVCREVAPCGDGDWGDIPVDGATEFVNAAYPLNDSDGSQEKPWKTINAGVTAAATGAIVAVAAGTYTEDVTIQGKAVKVWGRCPETVEIKGVSKAAVITISGSAADASELRGASITGPNTGITVNGSSSVILERIRIHDTGHSAIDARNAPSSLAGVTLAHSLIERATVAGVYAKGATITVDRSVVRETACNTSGRFGRGIDAESEGMTRANVTVSGSRIERNHEMGILVGGSDALIDATVVEETQPNGNGVMGIGVFAEAFGAEPRAKIAVTRSLIERNHDVAIYVGGSDAVIEATVARETQPLTSGLSGLGVVALPESDTGEFANVAIVRSLIDRNHEASILVGGSQALIEASLVRKTLPNGQGKFGIGVQATDDIDTEKRASITMRGSVIDENSKTGIIVEGADGLIDAVVVRDNLGHGIEAVNRRETGHRSNVTVRASLIERNFEVGALVRASDVQIESTVMRETKPDATNEGLGIHAQSDAGQRASLHVRGALIEKNLDTGIAVDGSEALIESSVVRETLPRGDTEPGRGLNVQGVAKVELPTEVTVRASVVEKNHGLGIFVAGAKALIEATVVRENGLEEGGGITVQSAGAVARTGITVRASLIERNQGLGIFVSESDVQIEATVVRETRPDPDGTFGRGIQVQMHPSIGQRANAGVIGSLIEKNYEAGVFVVNSEAKIESTLVRGTMPNDYGEYGDGIVAISDVDNVSKWAALPPSVGITRTRLDSNARAGIASFGGSIQLVSSVLTCHKFDLNGEDQAGYTWSFDGSRDNSCGCPEPTGKCGAKSAGLAPPTPLVDPTGPLPPP